MSVTAKPQTTPPQGASSPHDRYFRTDHLVRDLGRRAVRGGTVTLAAQGAKFFLQMGSTMVLARLLTPADYGLVAMVTAVTGFVGMFKDAGLSMATIQREQITHDQVSTLFWINAMLGTTLAVFTAALAPGMAWLYGESRLTPIALALGATFIFSGLTVQHQALLRRQMRFTHIAMIDVLAALVGATVGVSVALCTRSYWALVAMPAATACTNVMGVWVASGWIPGRPRRGAGITPLLKFGGCLTASQFLGYMRRNLDNVLIGATWGSAALGLYSKSYSLLTLPIQQINAPISSVAICSLSRALRDPAAFRRAYCTMVECIALLGLAVVTPVLLEAETVVALVLGAGWEESANIFRALGPAALMSCLNIAGGSVFVSTGRADKQLKETLVTTPLVAAAFIAGLPWGPIGVATAFSIVYCAIHPPIILYAISGTSVAPWHVLQALARPIVATLCMCLAWWVLSQFLEGQDYGIVRLLVAPCVGMCIYPLLPGNLLQYRKLLRHI